MTSNTDQVTRNPGFSPSKHYPSLSTILAYVIVVALLYAFITGMTLRFYASFLFMFYHLIGKMWIAVMCLGVFQTLLMLPLRVINLIKSKHIQEFKDAIAETQQQKEQQILLRKQIGKGSRAALYYWVNFIIQTVSYVSLGRLFLIDFYRFELDPSLLYSFVPYPEYPIQSVIFKLPYPWFTDTVDFGVQVMFVGFGLVMLLQLVLFVVRALYRRYGTPQPAFSRSFLLKTAKWMSSSVVILLILTYVLTRHLPVGWRVFVFSGDITRPYPTFNLITAIATASTVLWLNIPKIRNKVSMAIASNVPADIVQATSRNMMRNAVRNALVIGAGAYFITNQIPSAFELSIFTLELISWTAPLTLDRAILSVSKNVTGQNTMDHDQEVISSKQIHPESGQVTAEIEI